MAAPDPAQTGTLEVRVVGDSDGAPLGFQLSVRAAQWPYVLTSDAQHAAALELAAAASETDGVFSAAPRSAFETSVRLESRVATLTRLVPGLELELTVTDAFLAPLATRRVMTPQAGTRGLVELRVPSSASSMRRMGRVVDGTGRGLPRANVRVELGRTVATWTTDADGRFTLPFGDRFADAVR